MTDEATNPVEDLRGIGRLTADGVVEVTNLVESMHRSISTFGGVFGPRGPESSSGITGLVYGSIRGMAGLVGSGVDAALAPLGPLAAADQSSVGRDTAVAIVNGVLGDHLVETDNPLAISMQFRRGRERLDPDDPEFRRALRAADGRIALMLHGSCTDESQWQRGGDDHGAALARDHGYLPVYLRYNSGLHISQNGAELAARLEELVGALPGPVRLTFVGHSMGGLVARSACHYAQKKNFEWLERLDQLACIGSPHHGAPLERYGNWIDNALELTAYTAPFARLGKLRSAGVTDLRFGNLLHRDWQGRDRFEWSDDPREPVVALPDGATCYAIAAVTDEKSGPVSAHLPGDGLVPLDSALGHHDDPEMEVGFREEHKWIARDTGHLELLDDPEVYAKLAEWLRPASAPLA